MIIYFIVLLPACYDIRLGQDPVTDGQYKHRLEQVSLF
jgi:hypothetical protein